MIMKKTVILSFAAALAAVACTNEPLVPCPQMTTIKVKVEASKTSFGAESEGTLPVVWSEGDAISVNGVASGALAAGGAATAEFSFATELQAPYYAVYPASAVEQYGSESTTVILPDTQNYTQGSFDPAAGILVGTGDEQGISLVNAMTYLKITPTGASKNIAAIVITANGGEAICGEFTTDFSGISAAESATSELKIDCGDGIAVNTPVIVALPAQTYTQGLSIKVYDLDGGVVEKTSKSSAAMAAGHIYSTSVNVTPDVLYLSGGHFSKYNDEWGQVTACPLVPVGDGIYVTENDVYLDIWCYFHIANADYSRDYARVDGAENYWTAHPKAGGDDKPFIPGNFDSSWKDGYYMVIFDTNTMTVRYACVGGTENMPFYLNGYSFLDGKEDWTQPEERKLNRVASGIYKTAQPVKLQKWGGFKFDTLDWTEYVRDNAEGMPYWSVAVKNDNNGGNNFVPGYDSEIEKHWLSACYNITLNLRTMRVEYEYVGTLSGEAIDENIAFYIYGDGFGADLYPAWTFDNRLALMPTELGVYTSVAPIYISEWCWFKFDRKDWAEYVRDQTATDYWTVTPRIWYYEEGKDNGNECNFLPNNGGIESGWYTVTLNLLDYSVTLTPVE